MRSMVEGYERVIATFPASLGPLARTPPPSSARMVPLPVPGRITSPSSS